MAGKEARGSLLIRSEVDRRGEMERARGCSLLGYRPGKRPLVAARTASSLISWWIRTRSSSEFVKKSSCGMEGLTPTMVGKVQDMASGVVGEITAGEGTCEK